MHLQKGFQHKIESDRTVEDRQKKGKPGNNQIQNKQLRDAAKEITISDNRKLMELFKRCVEHCSRQMGLDLDFYDLKKIAEIIKSERKCDCNG